MSLPEREKRNRAEALQSQDSPITRRDHPAQHSSNLLTTLPLLSDSTDSELEEYHDGTDDPERLEDKDNTRSTTNSQGIENKKDGSVDNMVNI